MTTSVEVLEAEFLRLSVPDRARFLDRVIARLDADKLRDEAWDRLAANRQAEFESGAARSIPGPEFLDQLRSELL